MFGALEALFAIHGIRALHLTVGTMTRQVSAKQIEVGETPEEYEKLLPLLSEDIQGLIHVLPHEGEPFSRTQNTENLFLLLKALAPLFKTPQKPQKGIFNLSFMGGGFALDHTKPFAACDAGSIGLMKTVAREWPHCRVQCLDFDPTLDTDRLMSAFWQALTLDNPAVELGFNHEGSYTIALIEEEPNVSGVSGIKDGAVILVTGGAYGITADCAIALAQKIKAHFILLGRSALPEVVTWPNDPDFIRGELIAKAKAQNIKKTPVEIELEVKKIIKDRAILSSLERLKEQALSVQYHSLDVRDENALSAVIQSIDNEHGRLDGIIHGAGVIEDKWLADKSFDAFSRVFSTKVDAALTLAKHVDLSRLAFFAFFSSVSSRFGNIGQSDYSAANEVLNKLADVLADRFQGRMVAINWGPWDSGMVSDGLRKLYQSRGIELIPIEEGVEAFVDEVLSFSGDAEVVITCSAGTIASGGLGKGMA